MNTPTAVNAIVERCQALFDDLDFNAVKQWKAAVPGRKAIGYMPIYVPREIIHAAGFLPLGILGGGDQLEVIHGDAYYQSYICRIPRSTIELGVSGRLDFVDGMLFPSICDVIRNLSGMWKMMFPHVYARYFDVPQNYKDEIGGNYYVNELAELTHDLGELRGRPIADDELRHGQLAWDIDAWAFTRLDQPARMRVLIERTRALAELPDRAEALAALPPALQRLDPSSARWLAFEFAGRVAATG